MRNGRFNTSKCRGKLQKMRVMYSTSILKKGLAQSLNFQKIIILNQKNFKKLGHSLIGNGLLLRPVGD
jgi:hypothetical protein